MHTVNSKSSPTKASAPASGESSSHTTNATERGTHGHTTIADARRLISRHMASSWPNTSSVGSADKWPAPALRPDRTDSSRSNSWRSSTDSAAAGEGHVCFGSREPTAKALRPAKKLVSAAISNPLNQWLAGVVGGWGGQFGWVWGCRSGQRFSVPQRQHFCPWPRQATRAPIADYVLLFTKSSSQFADSALGLDCDL